MPGGLEKSKVAKVVPKKKKEQPRLELDAVTAREVEIVSQASADLGAFERDFSAKMELDGVIFSRAIAWMELAGISEQETLAIVAMSGDENPYMVDFLKFIKEAIKNQYFFDKKASVNGALAFRDKKKKVVSVPDLVPLAMGWVRLKKVLGGKCEKELVDKAFAGELPSFMELFAGLREKSVVSKDLVEWVKWEFKQLKEGASPKKVVVCEDLNRAIGKRFDYKFIKRGYDSGLSTVRLAFDELMKGGDLTEDLIEWSRYELIHFQSGESVSVIMNSESSLRETSGVEEKKAREEGGDDGEKEPEGQDGEEVNFDKLVEDAEARLGKDLSDEEKERMRENLGLDDEDGNEEDYDKEFEEGEEVDVDGEYYDNDGEDLEPEPIEITIDGETYSEEEYEEYQAQIEAEWEAEWEAKMEKERIRRENIDRIKEEKYGMLLRQYEGLIQSIDPFSMTNEDYAAFNVMTARFLNVVGQSNAELAEVNVPLQEVFAEGIRVVEETGQPHYMFELIGGSPAYNDIETIWGMAEQYDDYETLAAIDVYAKIIRLWFPLIQLYLTGYEKPPEDYDEGGH